MWKLLVMGIKLQIESKLKLSRYSLKVAETSISEGHLKLEHALTQNIFPRKDIQSAQSLINMGLERKCSIKNMIGA